MWAFTTFWMSALQESVLPALFVYIQVALSHSFSCLLRNSLWQDWPTFMQQTVLAMHPNSSRQVINYSKNSEAHTTVIIASNSSNIVKHWTFFFFLRITRSSTEGPGEKRSCMQSEKWINDEVHPHMHTKYDQKLTPMLNGPPTAETERDIQKQWYSQAKTKLSQPTTQRR